jgi:hypothetical protein
MPGDSGVTVVTTSCALTTNAHETAGASGARHSLRPLISESATFPAKLAWMRGEIAKLWLQESCLEIQSVGWAKAHLRRAHHVSAN